MSRRTKNQNLATDESMTLRYIDGDVTETEAEAIVAHFASGSAFGAARLKGMQADREALCDIEPAKAPAGMIEDVLASVERSLLLDDDPIAPPVKYPSRTRWTVGRLAAAAVVVLLVSVGSGIIWQSLITLRGRPELVKKSGIPDDAIATSRAKTPAPVNSPTVVDRALAGESEGALAAKENRPSLSPIGMMPGIDSTKDTPILTNEALARNDLNAGSSLALVPAEGSTDISLRLRIETADLNATLLELLSQLEESETELALNADVINGRIEITPIDYYAARSINGATPNITRPPVGRERVKRLDLVGRLKKDLKPSQRVPIQAQLDYQKEGYQWVFVGTLSEIRDLRNNLHRRRDHQAHWLRPAGMSHIEDLIPPRRPSASEWGAILLWWHNPQERWSLIEEVRASFEPEPIIRVPVRFEVKPELGRFPVRPATNTTLDDR